MKRSRLLIFLGILPAVLLLGALGLSAGTSQHDSAPPTETPLYMPAGGPLDSGTLTGTWYASPCGDTSYTFSSAGTYQVQGTNRSVFNHSNTYRWVDAHHVELDGLEYNAAMPDAGQLDLFDWPVGIALQRSRVSCPPIPDSTGIPTETSAWPTWTPLPSPVPTAPLRLSVAHP